MVASLVLPLTAAAALALSAGRIRTRLRLSRAKHRSLAGHARMARRIARQVPFFDHGEELFASDGAAPAVVARRRAGFDRLSALFAERFSKTGAMSRDAAGMLPDLAFTSRYRVPFPFARLVRERLGSGSFLEGASGAEVVDPDGNRFHDLGGSYGLNLWGTDVLRDCIDEGAARARDLGPVLGSYHPIVTENARRLCAVSGQDAVSFHMSGTEAVMQAVRLAQYHTGRPRIVRFCGSYHGWWGDVQPGIGNPVAADRTLTLAEMSERTLRVLATRRDVACVLVNPVQALHPNAPAPSDSALLDSSRPCGYDRAAYTDWLHRLRDVCTKAGIALIFDEVFVGFRLARGGAQEYFGVRADLVTYGKTLGGGLPVGVLCGRAELMKRYRDDRPADICFARGTFNAHPYVMGAMAAFLDRLDDPKFATLYAGLDERWDARCAAFNAAMEAAGLPVRAANLQTIWTVRYLVPSRFNWMLQFYLRAHGLALSWIGTGRLIFSLDCSDEAFASVSERFVAAASAMQADGWWEPVAESNKALRRRMLREMLAARWRGRRAAAA